MNLSLFQIYLSSNQISIHNPNQNLNLNLNVKNLLLFYV